jgi:hypothetical protein
VDQWPLTGEKLAAAQALIQEQLQAGHIEISHSPWNTPSFVIKKKSGKWRLLQDLRAINKVMQPMGSLQLGLPSPTAIPLQNYLYIIDLKDCFLLFHYMRKIEKNFPSLYPCLTSGSL